MVNTIWFETASSIIPPTFLSSSKYILIYMYILPSVILIAIIYGIHVCMCKQHICRRWKQFYKLVIDFYLSSIDITLSYKFLYIYVHVVYIYIFSQSYFNQYINMWYIYFIREKNYIKIVLLISKYVWMCRYIVRKHTFKEVTVY